MVIYDEKWTLNYTRNAQVVTMVHFDRKTVFFDYCSEIISNTCTFEYVFNFEL